MHNIKQYQKVNKMNELKKVNIFCGRFQPFHKGHLKCCEDVYKENGYPVFIFYTPNKQFDDRKPFDDKLLEEEYDILTKKYDYIEGYDWMKFPQPVRICRVLKEKGYEAVLWLAGEDRMDNYKKMLNKTSIDKIDNELNVSIPELYLTNRYGSATAVRAALKNNDKQKYIELMPDGTEKLYDKFLRQINALNESKCKSLRNFVKESMITSLSKYINEGGNSIPDAEPIRGDLAKIVSDDIIKLIKDKFKCEAAALGSVGKKGKNQTCGDIDIALEYDWANYEDVLDYVKKTFNCEIGNINKSLHVFNIGYEYNDGTQNKIVQVDFMFTDNVDFAKFAYNSPDFTKNESKYKGMYQSGLLMSIISNTPVNEVIGNKYKDEYFSNNDYDGTYAGQLKSYWKFSFNQNDGLKLVHKSFEGKTKPVKTEKTINQDTKIISKNVNEIIKMILGDKATRETCNSFESELNFICSRDYKFYSKEILNKIKDSFLNDWQLKLKTPEQSMKEFEEIFNEKINNIK